MNKNTDIQKAILRVLKYFNFFTFPLTFQEIERYIELLCSEKELQENLNILIDNGQIFFIRNNYLLEPNQQLVIRKEKGAKKAKIDIKRAITSAKIIASFPFVRMVAVSGSLSKNYSDDKSDLDFFIVTNEHNLWTSRMMLHLFKKLTFLVNKQHDFCMNYFLADNKLQIEEQNYFTAIELNTLMPIYGKEVYNQLQNENDWVLNFLPNTKTKTELIDKPTISFVKNIVEFIFKSKKISHFCMTFTDKVWRKKWAKKGMSSEEYDLAIKTKKYVSKHHPANFQKITLENLNKDN